MNHYRNEYERKNILTREDMIPEDARFVARHWAKEANAWLGELRRWQEFKQAQQKYHQCDRSELDLELENTDVTLVEALSKLNDWQEFHLMHVTEVHEAERFYELCQQGISRTHGAMVVASSADPMLNFKESQTGWMSDMKEAQERLETSRKTLSWIKSQWPAVIAEACSLVAAAPKLLEQQLEAKFERQTKATYRTLQEKGAIPRHAVHAPDENASLPQRIQHWVSESSALDQELWEWRIFMAWRRHIRNSGNTDQQGRRVLSEGDSRSELFEDFVKYQQYGFDKAISWVNCWRQQARKHSEENVRSTSVSAVFWWNRCFMVHDDDNKENEVPEAKRAETYAMQAEGNVSVAGERLEMSKQKLRDILAESGPSSTSVTPLAYTETHTPPTPPNSPSPDGLQKSRRSSKQKDSGRNGYRRSKKERARRREANVANANTEQHALPNVSLSSKNLDENDANTQMSNDAEDPSPIELKKKSNQKDSDDAFMSDAEDRMDRLSSSPPGSHPQPIPKVDYTNVPSSRSPSPISMRTRSATKRDQVPSFKVLKKPSKNKPTKKAKAFTEQRQMALLNAAATEHTTVAPTSLGRIEHNPYPTPPTSTHNSQTSSPPSPRPPTSRKTRSAKALSRVPSAKIHKNSNKDKTRKKAKTFTEEQTQMLLNAATSSRHSPSPTSPENPVTDTYQTPHTSANSNTNPSPTSPSLPSREILSAKQLDHIPSGKSPKATNQQNKSRKKANNHTNQQTPALKNAAPANCPPTSFPTLRRSERLKMKAAAAGKRSV